MRGVRRGATWAGFLGLALLPVAAMAVSRDRTPGTLPMAIVQPAVAVGPPPVLLLPALSPRLSEAGLLILVGTGLLGLGAVVRRTT